MVVAPGEHADLEVAREMPRVEAADHARADHADPLDRHEGNANRLGSGGARGRSLAALGRALRRDVDRARLRGAAEPGRRDRRVRHRLLRIPASARSSRAIGREWGGELCPFVLAGLLAPGGSQLLFVLAVREAGPARASVIAGAAPLVAVTIAVIALGEPVRAPLLVGAVLIVAGGLALIAERERPESFRAIGLAFSFGCTDLLRDPGQRRPPARLGHRRRASARRGDDDPLRCGGDPRLRRRHAPGPARRPTSDARPRPSSLPGPALGRVVRVPLRGLLPRAGERSSARWSRPSRSSASCSPCCSCDAPSWSGATSLLGALLVVAGGALIGAFR